MKVDGTVCEFRLVRGATGEDGTPLVRAVLPAVPAYGELVNVNGDPYVVRQRAWAFTTDPARPGDPPGSAKLHCYLYVCRPPPPRPP